MTKRDLRMINIDTRLTFHAYDCATEEFRDIELTVEEILRLYTDEGCPTIFLFDSSALDPKPETHDYRRKS